MKYFLKFIILILATTLFASASKKIVVDLAKQEAFAYEDNKLVMKGWISSGREKYKTPIGKYRVLAKEKFHISNEWPEPDGGAEMPYMLRITWSGIALHLGYVPNHPASHGCVRLKNKFAQELFKWANVGTIVIIKGKQHKWVSRKHRSPFYLTKYFYKKHNTSYIKERKYLARENKSLQKLSRTHHLAMQKKKAKRLHLAKKSKVKKHKIIAQKRAISKKSKLVNYYSKFSYRKLNKILKINYRKKSNILASNKLSKHKKVKKLKRIRWIMNIVKEAKRVKHSHKYRRVAIR